MMTYRKNAIVFVLFFIGIACPFFAQVDTKTEHQADGAGSIVFDTSVLPELTGDQAVSLFDYTLGDKQVSFLAQGYWQSTIANTTTYTFGFGSTPGFSWGTPVFAQKVDLSLWFMLHNHWYFEADFADAFTKNTVAAGYVGDGVVKALRIANRGIVFPSSYAIEEVHRGIGGGDNQAPGLSFHAAGKRWQSHAVVRYDMLSAEEKTWYGKNSVSTDTIALSAYQTGSRYVLPTSQAVNAVQDVYVEHSSGTYRDAQGRRYKKLAASQYLLLASSYTVLLAKDAGAAKKNGVLPAVAFRFRELSADSVAAAADTTMIAALKDWFLQAAVAVETYFFDVRTDAAANQFVSTIDGERVLFVQHPAGFSPFTVAYRYDAGLTAATDAVVAFQQTDIAATDFVAVMDDDDVSFVSEDFFYPTHTYASIYRTDRVATDMRSPEVRFPLAPNDAGIYVGYGQKTDLALKIRTYTAVARFDIGTDAVPGTVRVYKNGILDSNATYDAESGTIVLSSAVSDADHIYATWYEEQASAESGAITAAVGFAYQPFERLTTDVAFATRWTFVVGKAFADADYAAPGFATLASRVQYQGDYGAISNTIAASLETENTTGTFRILGMQDTASDTTYLAKNAAVNLPDGFVPVLNARDNTTSPLLELEKNGSVTAEAGKTDGAISGYAIPVHWDFSAISDAQKSAPAWSAIAIKLPAANGALAAATSVSIALKNQNNAESAFSVYLQLGVQADDAFLVEDTTVVPTWCVSKETSVEENPLDVRRAFVPGLSGWQTVTVVLTERDRTRLAYYHDARIIIVSEQTSTGTIVVGPYQIEGSGFSVDHASDTMVHAYQTTDASLSAAKIDTFNTATNYVQQFDWHTTGIPFASAADDFVFTATHYFEEIDLQQYETLSLWFRYYPTAEEPLTAYTGSLPDSALTLTLDRPDAQGHSQTAIRIVLSKEQLTRYTQTTAEKTSSDWHELTLSLLSHAVKIDGHTVAALTNVSLSVVPVRFTIAVATADAEHATYYARGECAIDELALFGMQPYIVLQDKVRANWKKDGVVIEKNGYGLVQDVLLAVTGSGTATIQTHAQKKNEGVFDTTAQAAFTLAPIRFTGEAAFASGGMQAVSSAAHTIQTVRPLLRVLSLAEKYSYNPDESAVEKENSASLQGADWGIPLLLSAQTSAQSNAWAVTQKVQTQAQTTAHYLDWQLRAGVEQKLLPSAAPAVRIETDSYGQSWFESTKRAFDTGDERASKRTVFAASQGAVQLPFFAGRPGLRAETTGIYTAATESFADDTSVAVEFPFSIAAQHVSVSWKKKGGGVAATQQGGSYAADIDSLADAYKTMTWFFTALPFYDVVSSRLAHAVHADTAASHDSASRYYTGLYEFSWKRPFFGNSWDMVVPATGGLSFARDIRTATNISDVYQLKANIGYTAINIFGITGAIPLATWFQQDEYAASLSAAVKIPRTAPQQFSLLCTGYAQAHFFMTSTQSLRAGIEGSFEDENNWNGKVTTVWKRLSSHSLVLDAITLVRPRYNIAAATLTRTDSLNLGASRAKTSSDTTATQKINAEYTHQLDVAVNKWLTIHTLLGGSYACTWNKIITLNATLSLGASIAF